jgi:hypothetical protein
MGRAAALAYSWIDAAGGIVIGGAGDGRVARGQRRGEMRASHADRERVVDRIKAAYVYGLVTKDEFDARVCQTLASRTHGELALVTADIPAGLPAAPSTLGPAGAKAGTPARPRERPVDGAVAASAVLSALAFLAAVLIGSRPGPDAAQVGGLLAVGAVGSGLVSLFLVAVHAARSRRGKRSGGQLPRQRAIDIGRSTAELPHASQPRRPGPADAARSRSLLPGVST